MKPKKDTSYVSAPVDISNTATADALMKKSRKDLEGLLMSKATQKDLERFYPQVTEDRILVLRDEVSEKTEGGIYIPGVAKEEYDNTTTRGTILKLGAITEKTKGYEYIVGYRIAFGKYAGSEFEWDNKTFMFLHVHDVLAVWKPEDEL